MTYKTVPWKSSQMPPGLLGKTTKQGTYKRMLCQHTKYRQCQTEQRATSTIMKLWSAIWLQLLNLVKQSTYNPWIDVPSNGRRSIGSKDAFVFSLVFILNFAVFRLPYFIAFWYLSLEFTLKHLRSINSQSLLNDK